ncbi:MAG: RNA polymerase sigma factor [Candidatus Nomurabacteria bacterium]|nr:RNA polymerase sigma factor [Candidatus Nomurabacteria bacterium]USN87418.1 MAG: RNA polymerase sigma factor [Candidatus Nomurabacteria bacterium]
MAGRKQTDDITESQEDSFLKAFDEYSDALFRHAVIRVNNREKAIDIVQDTFTKVWTYIRAGHKIDAYRSFLYKVLNNLIIDSYRKQKELSLDSLFEAEGVDEGSFADLTENNTEALAATIDGRKAFELLAELPDTYREVITFRFVDGLGPKEISELIEESENVVSVRLHRGLKMLRDKMEEKSEVIKKGKK